VNEAGFLVEEGKNCIRENRLARAEEVLRKAVASCPDDGSAHFELGKCCFLAGRYGEAIASLAEALRLDAGNVHARVMLAKSHKMTGDYAAAKETLSAVGPGGADEPEINQELAEVTARLDDIAASGTACLAAEKCSTIARVSVERYPIETRGFRAEITPYRGCITWFVNHKCNYHCSYCQSGFREPEGFRVLAPEQWRDIWKDLYERYGTLAIQATGGEPTLYPDFFAVLREMARFHNVEIQTNLSWDPEALITTVPPECVSRVGASFHQEHEQFDVFLEKMKKLSDAGYKVETSYVGYPPFLRTAETFLARAQAARIPFTILSYQGEFEGRRYPESYTEEEKDKLRMLNHAHDGRAASRAEWDVQHKVVVDRIEEKDEILRTCRMGQMYAWIQPDGRAMRCCKSPVPLGNLLDGTFRFLDEAQPCRVSSCICFRSMVVGEETRWQRQWPGTDDTTHGREER
jgi:MoaA/NifB/PqqE/SkfB family radical SAM enzyme